MPVPVLQKMRLVKTNPGPKARVRGFSVEEDLIILDRIIPQLKKMDLSSSGFFSQTDTLELATEFHRNPETVRGRWERYLQPWLLQHMTGTSGFRVERMLTRFVAQNFKDYRGIDWQKIVSQHKRQCQIRVRFESREMQFFKVLGKWFSMTKYLPIIVL